MTSDLEEGRVPSIFTSLLVCFLVGVALFVGLVYRQGDLSLLAFLVLLVVAAAKLWSGMSHHRLTYTIRVDKRRAFPGESLTVETIAENAKLLPVRIRLAWALDGALKPVDGAGQEFRQETGLLWFQRVRLQTNIMARRRGVYRIGPNCIRAGDLLGFFEKEKPSREATLVIVYPRLVCLKSIPLPMHELFGVPGVKSPVKDPLYILGTRDYQPSGPSRHIHWKASARHLKLQEKVFEPSEQEKVLLSLEVGSFQECSAADAFERTLEVIGSLALQLHDRGCAVALAANGGLSGGDRSSGPEAVCMPGQLSAILEMLARMQMKPAGDLEPVLRRYLGARRGFSCAYFCYQANPAAAEVRKYCSRRHVPLTIFTYRPYSSSETIQPTGNYGVRTIDEILIQEVRTA